MAPSRHDWKIVDWDVKPQHNQPTNYILEPRREKTCLQGLRPGKTLTGLLIYND